MARYSPLHLLLIAIAAAPLLPAAEVIAQEVRAGQAEAITLSGFISATAFAQDGLFLPGHGQNAKLMAADGPDRWWQGGDVRNTRIRLGVRAPDLPGDWQAGGTLELDFFGGFPGVGGYVAEQPLPRLRLAYAEMTRGATTLRIGQDWAPLLGNIPESVTHIGFPLGFGSAGLVGWRFPGVFLFRDLVESEDLRIRFRGAVMRGGWNDAPNPQQPSAGQFALPQFQARLDLQSQTGGGTPWSAYLVGHLDRKDLDAVGGTGTDQTITGRAAAFGGSLRPGNLTIHGNTYLGRAIGQQLGHILQFGDVGGYGAWVQAGMALTPRWSVWTFAGFDNPDDDDLGRPDDRLHNATFNQMLRLQEGSLQVGLEWLHARTRYREPTPGQDRLESGNQVALSARVSF